jgi:hypothetical protein
MFDMKGTVPRKGPQLRGKLVLVPTQTPVLHESGWLIFFRWSKRKYHENSTEEALLRSCARLFSWKYRWRTPTTCYWLHDVLGT